jgi:hypothetical protein
VSGRAWVWFRCVGDRRWELESTRGLRGGDLAAATLELRDTGYEVCTTDVGTDANEAQEEAEMAGRVFHHIHAGQP